LVLLPNWKHRSRIHFSKVPTVKLSLPLYQSVLTAGTGFIPTMGKIDSQGYMVDCACVRTITPCPKNCCSNGVCFLQNGTCACSYKPPLTDPLSCCLPNIPCPNSCCGNAVCDTIFGNCSTCNNGTRRNTTDCCLLPPPPPQPCPNNCCGNGVCNTDFGQCLCTQITVNITNMTDCCDQFPYCYNNGSFCNGKGSCNISDLVTYPNGTCNCIPAYQGLTCDTPSPTPPPIPPCYNNGTYCNGQGSCDLDATQTLFCNCSNGFSGSNCSILPCANLNLCSGNGNCTNGACVCTAGYQGAKCDTPKPPPFGCANFSYAQNCSQCLPPTQQVNLTCIWCPNTTDPVVALVAGSCINATQACNFPNYSSACTPPPPPPYNPPCPDQCYFNNTPPHGLCVNASDCALLEQVYQKGSRDCGKFFVQAIGCPRCVNWTGQTNGTICACYPGWKGSNCVAGAGANFLIGAISAGVIAAIVIAAVIGLAIAGGGTLAVSTQIQQAHETKVVSNPLYEGKGTEHQNALHRG